MIIVISVFLLNVNSKIEEKEAAITQATFDKIVLESGKPVLVDFWATWCGPCRMMAPVVEEIGKEYSGKLNVVKVDVDQNGSIANQYQISSIPTLLFFKKGKIVDQQVGVVSKEELRQKVDLLLGK